MPEISIFTGTLKRAHHADASQSAFGIYRHDFEDGRWKQACVTATEQPGWITFSPDGRTLYALNEVRDFGGSDGGAVSVFSVDPSTGNLTLLGVRRTGGNPCFAEVDATGSLLLVATFHGGCIHMFPIGEDGMLGQECARIPHHGASVHPKRQTSPHPHGIAIAPNNTLVLVPDLGTDRVEVYRLDAAQQSLQHLPEKALAMPPASGPRHACFTRKGDLAYVINEMSANIAVLTMGADGFSPKLLQNIHLLPDDFAGLRSGGELALSPCERFLYATTRSHGSSGMPEKLGLDAVHWLSVSADTGLLTKGGSRPTSGGIPRAFCIEEQGQHIWIAHQCNSTITRHALDRDTGSVGPAMDMLESPVPVCVRMRMAD